MALMSLVRLSEMMTASARPTSAAATTMRKMTKFRPTASFGATYTEKAARFRFTALRMSSTQMTTLRALFDVSAP